MWRNTSVSPIPITSAGIRESVRYAVKNVLRPRRVKMSLIISVVLSVAVVGLIAGVAIAFDGRK